MGREGKIDLKVSNNKYNLVTAIGGDDLFKDNYLSQIWQQSSDRDRCSSLAIS
jgi:hypothetical protein